MAISLGTPAAAIKFAPSKAIGNPIGGGSGRPPEGKMFPRGTPKKG